MFGIPGPPAPQWSDPVAFGLAASSLAVGVLILLWGRYLARALLCAIGIITALLLAGPVARRFELNLLLVRLVGAVVMAVGGLILARLVWAALVGMLFGIPAECLVLGRCLQEIAKDKQPVFDAAEPTFTFWALGICKFFLSGFRALWGGDLGILLAVVCPALVLPLVITLIRDRLGRIFMTSLLGGGAIVLGPIIAVAQLRQSMWGGIWRHWYVPLVLAGGLMVTGLIVQYRGAIRGDRANKDREAEPRETTDNKSARKTNNKK